MATAASPLLDYSNANDPEGSGEDSERSDEDFVADPPATGLSSAEVLNLREKYGFNELAEKKRSPLLEFLGNFWGPMPIMIW